VQTVETHSGGHGAAGVSDETPSTRRSLRAFFVDHPFLFVFLAAFSARLLVAIVLSVSGKLLSVAPDSTFFVNFGIELSGGPYNLYAGIEWSSASHFASYLVPVTGLFWLFGPSYFLAQLVAVVFGAVAATATARLAREFLPTAWAVGAGLVVALFPTQVLWSSAAIRDSTVWAIAACMALALAVLLRSESRRQAILLALATLVCLCLFGWIREYALSIAAFSLFIVAIIVRAQRFKVVVAVVLALGAMFIPVAYDRDILGVRILRVNHLSQVRAANANNADSAFINPDELNKSDLSHLPEGLKVALLEPLPWTSLKGNAASYGRLEAPLRWLLLIGSLSALPLLWRRRRALGFVALYAAGVVVVLALGEGNFGTLDRHRGDLVWPMGLLTVAGVHYHLPTLQRWWRAIRHRLRPALAKG